MCSVKNTMTNGYSNMGLISLVGWRDCRRFIFLVYQFPPSPEVSSTFHSVSSFLAKLLVCLYTFIAGSTSSYGKVKNLLRSFVMPCKKSDLLVAAFLPVCVVLKLITRGPTERKNFPYFALSWKIHDFFWPSYMVLLHWCC